MTNLFLHMHRHSNTVPLYKLAICYTSCLCFLSGREPNVANQSLRFLPIFLLKQSNTIIRTKPDGLYLAVLLEHGFHRGFFHRIRKVTDEN